MKGDDTKNIRLSRISASYNYLMETIGHYILFSVFLVNNRKQVLNSFHLNAGHTEEFHPQTQKLQPPCTS